MKYGQFCPVAKSAEILGNGWTLLIVRELLMGSSRFSQLEKGMPRISPTVLTKRLKELEAHGVIIKRPISGQRGFEYFLTPAGKELAPVIESLVVWGMRWARDELRDDEMDVAFLMFDIERNIVSDELPGGETVLCFQFPDLEEYQRWWIVCDGDKRDLCYQDPGKDVSAYVTAASRDLIGVWMGDLPVGQALDDDRVTLLGDSLVCRRFRKWFPLSSAAGVPRPGPAG
ncbi:winged helix-turn-helix transcriptional regulator [Oceanomicrobium pacificus]|uniref:Transcriptional regulator n=1 Tax=Oceanomicrobium pacificus TaxID=2692916 RepID=A0A6B0TSK5_9RHOB|nr:helix-turn-helix domain-containing protein [Oceanomicrobium pacificus]MXU65729.1 transcriptional regulator [Oceanomicrobium pacificus]